MELLYSGKTKDLYQLEDGNVRLKFKDDMTGKDGVFDPGENQVGLTVEGSGKAGLAVTKFFFEKIEAAGIPTHYVDADIENTTMDVKKATVFGKGLEVICRYRAVGSFLRRYGAYVEEGQSLDAFVEVTIKDDDRQDPAINEEALIMLDIFKAGEYAEIADQTRQISAIVKEELAKKGLELFDIKLEFGRLDGTNEVVLIDEISGGNMRVFDKEGNNIHPLDFGKYLFN